MCELGSRRMSAPVVRILPLEVLMSRRVRIPKAYQPRSIAELAAASEQLGGKVSFLFSPAERDVSSAVVRPGALLGTVLDYEPAEEVPPEAAYVTIDEKQLAALRGLARIAARAWAKS